MDDINSTMELERENERLREELLLMRNQMLRMKTKLKEQQSLVISSQQQQQQQQRQTPAMLAASHNGHGNQKSVPGVLLELPVTMRKTKLKTSPQKPDDQQSQGLLSCISRKTDAAAKATAKSSKIQIPNGNHKDHSSVSTTDDRSTIEAVVDIEAHQSAAGLHQRLPYNNSVERKYNQLQALKSHGPPSATQTLKTGPTADDSLSSHDGDEMEGLVCNTQNVAAQLAADASDADNDEQLSFCKAVADRAGWLVGLLVFQSLSSFILARNEELLRHHAVIVQFLTMLVGAGGNAGNQASVGVVRGLAVGTIDSSNVRRFLQREFAMGLALSLILGVAGCVRAAVFAVPFLETMAITSSLFMIVVISVVAGALLPLGMNLAGIDPAHSSTTIQVIMDITGVVITVHVSSLVLDTDFRLWLEHAMSLEGETR
jgi:cation transporter-like permease